MGITRAEIIEIIEKKVKLNINGQLREKLYSYPKGVLPEYTDKVYLANMGNQQVIIAVHKGDG